MKLRDQVVSLDLAKELKALGVKQDSVWYWIQQGEYIDDWSEAFLASKKERDARYDPTLDGACSAYTVAELGEMLPYASFSMKLGISNKNPPWFCDSGLLYPRSYAKTEADARAKMMLYLVKEGRVKAEEKRTKKTGAIFGACVISVTERK